MEESDKENLYKNTISLDGLYAYNEAEKLVPKEKSLTDLMLYGLRPQKILPTIAVLYGCFLLSLGIFAMIISCFIILTYGIYLLRDNLKIKNTFRSDGCIILMFAYAFICLFCLLLPIFQIINNKVPTDLGFFTKMIYYHVLSHTTFSSITPYFAFINLFFAYGFIINFAINEKRAPWLFYKFFKDAFVINISGFALLLVATIFYNILTELGFIDTAGCFIFFFTANYIVILTIVCWSKFLYPHIYPKIPPEE